MKAHKTTFRAYDEESNGYDLRNCLCMRYIYIDMVTNGLFGSVILSGLLVNEASPKGKQEIDLYGCRLLK